MGCNQSQSRVIALRHQHHRHQDENSHETTATFTEIQNTKEFINETTNPQHCNSQRRERRKSLRSVYVLGEVLGEGAFSVVKKGTNRKTGQEVAVKCIDRNGLPEEDEASLRQEVEILRSLDHPNIVKLLDFFEEDKFFYVVLEFLPGGELFERIVKKSFYNEKEARDVVRTVCLGMKYCHDKGIAHRDLKPENLLLTTATDDAIVKIADFGFARRTTPIASLLQTQCGTPVFMAPEILRNRPYTVAVDMWSIGVITYLLLCGYPPFLDKNTNRLFKKITTGSYEFHDQYWSTVSDSAKDLIRGLLQVDSQTRFTVDDVLNHPWINDDDMILTARDLSSSLENLKRYDNKHKFRSVVKTIMLVNTLTRQSNQQHTKDSYHELINNNIPSPSPVSAPSPPSAAFAFSLTPSSILSGGKNKYSPNEPQLTEETADDDDPHLQFSLTTNQL